VCVYSVHLEVCCGLNVRLAQLDLIGRHRQHHFADKAHVGIVAGDLNTLGHGWLRCSPYHVTDGHRFATGSEAARLEAMLNRVRAYHSIRVCIRA
jgi:hypothetical protein